MSEIPCKLSPRFFDGYRDIGQCSYQPNGNNLVPPSISIGSNSEDLTVINKLKAKPKILIHIDKTKEEQITQNKKTFDDHDCLKSSEKVKIEQLMPNKEDLELILSGFEGIEPEIPLSVKFANNGLKTPKFDIKWGKNTNLRQQSLFTENLGPLDKNNNAIYKDDEISFQEVKKKSSSLWLVPDSENNSGNCDQDIKKEDSIDIEIVRVNSYDFAMGHHRELDSQILKKQKTIQENEFMQKKNKFYKDKVQEYLNIKKSKSYCDTNTKFQIYYHYNTCMLKKLQNPQKHPFQKKGIPPQSKTCFICDSDALALFPNQDLTLKKMECCRFIVHDNCIENAWKDIELYSIWYLGDNDGGCLICKYHNFLNE